jgi:hypothetical protein
VKWEKLGFRLLLKDKKPTTFTGVGVQNSTGKYKLPTSLQLIRSKLIIPGAVDSHETPDGKHPMLLSQSAQAKLGFTKSSRHGTITLDDYDNQEIEVVRQVKTGLFMICISHLNPKDYIGAPESMECLLIDKPMLAQSSEDSDYEDEHRSYAARRGDPGTSSGGGPRPVAPKKAPAVKIEPKEETKATPIPTKVLDAETIIVSCLGLAR